ncbi:MAG: hypothetical protein SOW65_04005, partial [Candidatus Enterosoma sp.]|nr:hypothetical protein [Candidatus Enterosoma sp.]
IFVFVVGSTIVVQVINNKFGVDILSTAFAIPKLVKEVDEETYITVPFEADEHKELAEQINAQVGDFIVYDLIFGSYKKKKPPKLSCLSRNRRLFFRIFFSTFNGFYCMRLYFLHLANLRTDDPSL